MTTETRRTICTARSFCTRLDERLNAEANHGKGLTEFRLTALRTGKSKRYGVNYKTNEKDRGLLITFCPWCGVNLVELFHLANHTSRDRGPDVVGESQVAGEAP